MKSAGCHREETKARTYNNGERGRNRREEQKRRSKRTAVISARQHNSLSLEEPLGVACGDGDSASSSREMQRALTAAYVSGWRPFVCQVPRSVGKSCRGHCRSASSFEPQGSTDLIF